MASPFGIFITLSLDSTIFHRDNKLPFSVRDVSDANVSRHIDVSDTNVQTYRRFRYKRSDITDFSDTEERVTQFDVDSTSSVAS